MQQLLNHTQNYSFNWSKSINDYAAQKRSLEWGSNPKPTYITQKEVKQKDLIYNPILQVFNDKSKENNQRQTERTNILQTIAINQDRQLAKEQIYNVINLRDRLKGMENDPNYPSYKPNVPKAKAIDIHQINYNVLSNKPLSQHHYDKPENRPKTDEQPTSKSTRTTSLSGVRDYDIISNKYKEYNEEKLEVDKKINKIQTAKLFYKKNDYNPVKGRFFDETKEAGYQLSRSERDKTWGQEHHRQKPACAKGQSDLYNLINMKVVNEQDLKLSDLKERNKKKRYELKVDIEDYYRNKNANEQIKKEKASENKCSYQRYNEIDKRYYDIIDLKEVPYKKYASVIKKDNLTDWEKIVNNTGVNNTFQSKSIYKDTYDYSDNAENYDRYTKGRMEKLKNLPEIQNDTLFNTKVPVTSKVYYKKVKEEPINDFELAKKKFFEPPKNVFYQKQKFKIINKNEEMSRVRIYYFI